MNTTVAILGNYIGTRGKFDWSRSDCDVWVLNEMLSNQNPEERWVERADLVFQMHAEPIWRNPLNRTDPTHANWLKTQNEVPILMQAAYIDVPKSEKYPLAEIQEKLLQNININNKSRVGVFSSSVAYAVALAIYRGYKRIETYGIEMGTETEYNHQREGVSFWYGLAAGLGIEVVTFTDYFMNAPLYGYEGEASIEYDVFKGALEYLKEPAAERLATYETTKEETLELLNSLRKEYKKENLQELAEAINKQLEAAANFGMVDGAVQENSRYIAKADAMKAAAGSYIFSRQEFESARNSMQEKHAESALAMQKHMTRLDLMFSTIERATSKRKREVAINQMTTVLDETVKGVTQTAILAGAIAQDVEYLKKVDAGIRAAGGKKSEGVLLKEASHV